MLEQSPKAIALKWLQTFNEKDCDELLNLYYMHAYYKRLPGRDLVGKDEISDYLIKLCLIQDFYLESQNILEDSSSISMFSENRKNQISCVGKYIIRLSIFRIRFIFGIINLLNFIVPLQRKIAIVFPATQKRDTTFVIPLYSD